MAKLKSFLKTHTPQVLIGTTITHSTSGERFFVSKVEGDGDLYGFPVLGQDATLVRLFPRFFKVDIFGF